MTLWVNLWHYTMTSFCTWWVMVHGDYYIYVNNTLILYLHCLSIYVKWVHCSVKGDQSEQCSEHHLLKTPGFCSGWLVSSVVTWWNHLHALPTGNACYVMPPWTVAYQVPSLLVVPKATDWWCSCKGFVCFINSYYQLWPPQAPGQDWVVCSGVLRLEYVWVTNMLNTVWKCWNFKIKWYVITQELYLLVYSDRIFDYKCKRCL